MASNALSLNLNQESDLHTYKILLFPEFQGLRSTRATEFFKMCDKIKLRLKVGVISWAAN